MAPWDACRADSDKRLLRGCHRNAPQISKRFEPNRGPGGQALALRFVTSEQAATLLFSVALVRVQAPSIDMDAAIWPEILDNLSSHGTRKAVMKLEQVTSGSGMDRGCSLPAKQSHMCFQRRPLGHSAFLKPLLRRPCFLVRLSIPRGSM